uniref:MSP domain-containing protein n=1 Tax=Angiostrongylus cantonensis TaxID=6313 RepID=A0A0K0D9L9_ANGCA
MRHGFDFVIRRAARLAIKITCSDNTLYRVTPVYAIVEPEQIIVLNIGRIEGVPKKDRLGILMIDYSGTGNAKDAFKVKHNRESLCVDS